MFKVNEYKIVFERLWHQPERHIATCRKRYAPSKQPCVCNKILELNGRYDTKCEIYTQDKTMVRQDKPDGIVFCKEPTFTGIAKLHPNDKPDKVDGKKFALRNAMALHDGDMCRIVYPKKDAADPRYRDGFFKGARTAIWKAFWVWVTSWK